MNEEDRKKVFWLLKKYSSYTAWAALGEAYARFAEAFEYAALHPLDVTGELTEEEFQEFAQWNLDHLKTILDGQIAFEKGLPLLREGQRSVFRNTSTGYLKIAASKINFIDRIMDPQEFVFDWMKNKDEVVGAANWLQERARGLYSVLENNDPTDVGANWEYMFDEMFQPFNFPLTLPYVPSPTNTTVNAAEEIRITGIWEPEWEISAGFIKALAGTQPRLERGCMNYLLAGAIAPRYRDSQLDPSFEVRWRLIWRDHRYEDGIIPEEEKDYLAEVAEPRQERLRGLPSEAVPKTGWWHTPALSGKTGLRYFKQGERFPEAESSAYGQVIWNYDPANQDPPQA